MYRKLLSLLVLLLLIVPLSAQDSESDLIAYFNKQVHILENDTLVPYDACMPDEEILGQFVPSPDGTRFIIGTFPKVISEALALFGSLGDIPYGQNYWLCDTTNDTLERIIVQPGADEPFANELPEIEHIMSQLRWSPDGTHLAWTQLNFEDDSQSIVIFDIATGESNEFEIDVPLAPFPSPQGLIAWTEMGMLLWVFEFDEETFFNIETLVVVDVETESITASYEILNGGENDDFYNQRELVSTPDGLKYVIEFQNQGWVLIDPETGEITPTSGRLTRTIPESEDSIVLQVEIDFEYNYNWQFIPDGDSEPVVLRAYPPQRIALSPDGTQLAYADSTLHIVDRDGMVTDIANSDGFADDFQAQLVWSASRLIFVELDETQLAPPSSCEGAPPIRLVEGISARVIAATVPNRIRSLPTTEGSILGEIPGGAELIVRGGPACADGYTWFQIEYNNIIGWTVEGSGVQYFIEPVSALP